MTGNTMNVCNFKFGNYTVSIKGVEEAVMPIEVVESDTYRVWQKLLTKEDLDGVILTELHEVLLAIQNALDDSAKSAVKPTFDLRLEKEGMALTLNFPSVVKKISFEFLLVEAYHDKLSLLQKQTLFLIENGKEVHAKLDKLEQNEEEKIAFQKELNSVKQNVVELCAKLDGVRDELDGMQHCLDDMKQKKEMEMSMREKQKLGDCGDGLHVSECGTILSKTDGVDGEWESAKVAETMARGKYYAEFQTLRMTNNRNHLHCGVIPSRQRILDDYIGGFPGGFCYSVHKGIVHLNGSDTLATGMPGCDGVPGPVIVGMKLDLDENNIQFFLNGKGSTIFGIPPGEYSFAASLSGAWDAAKLIRIEKLN